MFYNWNKNEGNDCYVNVYFIVIEEPFRNNIVDQ